ncbi:MAG: hypothetical protein A3F84_01630 [Candidatus Handelsmanbacteria bacterium RIFCSPLOWO2_12_FULL_64_10]|uniref:Holliday junction branch migration complex subunit RuvA n=1 Tax=Handelsmanbacteria sp. (strain RIFCSPLOWO2_12_FULL_64_10) TaxID=1817868 RepID=A0A1F6D4F9_HANXR|nr:MAG: hypothetical protein A3F84_01630 [Candidatus Handelsmanbacteria bacterium RIFCSPLOWO2_12_FULL_64_10]
MIAAVRGRVRRSRGNEVVLGLGSVDLNVLVPARTVDLLRPGTLAELFTHFVISGDQRSWQTTLYGFESEAALEVFELLITVSGVGPKAALGVLSTLEADEVRRAIIAGDQRTLTRAPGIGSRVAGRIVSELQLKVPDRPSSEGETPGGYGAALAALVGLGYSAVDARQALEVSPDGGPVEELIRSALEFLGSRK